MPPAHAPGPRPWPGARVVTADPGRPRIQAAHLSGTSACSTPFLGLPVVPHRPHPLAVCPCARVPVCPRDPEPCAVPARDAGARAGTPQPPREPGGAAPTAPPAPCLPAVSCVAIRTRSDGDSAGGGVRSVLPGAPVRPKTGRSILSRVTRGRAVPDSGVASLSSDDQMAIAGRSVRQRDHRAVVSEFGAFLRPGEFRTASAF